MAIDRKNNQDILLGKETEYKSEYDASLIYPIERKGNREKLTMPEKRVNGDLAFFGVDVWTGFEISWLTPKGKPQVAIAEFRIPAESSHIVESKSFKLYLNSYNQTAFESAEQARDRMQQDLSEGFGADIGVVFYDVLDYPLNQANLGENIDHLDIDISDYEPNASLLKAESIQVSETLNSHLLKSNCPVTNQPDWATVVIEYSGSKLNQEALLQYIISYRNHDDFHEHCVEQIFCDLLAVGEFEQLIVGARYTRRGGLDINPTRSLKQVYKNGELAQELIGRLARQ